MSEHAKRGDVFQIVSGRPGLIGAYITVDEVKPWGFQGFVHHVDTFENASQIWLRPRWEDVARVGQAAMVLRDPEEDDDE